MSATKSPSPSRDHERRENEQGNQVAAPPSRTCIRVSVESGCPTGPVRPTPGRRQSGRLDRLDSSRSRDSRPPPRAPRRREARWSTRAGARPGRSVASHRSQPTCSSPDGGGSRPRRRRARRDTARPCGRSRRVGEERRPHRRVAHVQVDVAHGRARRPAAPGHLSPLAHEPREVQRIGSHHQLAADPTPCVSWAIGIHLDAEIVRVLLPWKDGPRRTRVLHG